MKVNVIPDIHGEVKWKKVIDESCDKIIFLGDYVDSFTVSNDQIITNLKDIISFKKENPDKVVLLWGNHDIMYYYLQNPTFKCPGYRPEIGIDLREIYKLNSSLFQYAYQIKDFIFTHAGIQNNWFINEFKGLLFENIADQLNNPKNQNQFLSIHDVGFRRGGWKDAGGIVWCDKNELKKPLKNYNQIVGHTQTEQMIEFNFTSDKLNKNKKNSVYFCDCLNKLTEPLIFNI